MQLKNLILGLIIIPILVACGDVADPSTEKQPVADNTATSTDDNTSTELESVDPSQTVTDIIEVNDVLAPVLTYDSVKVLNQIIVDVEVNRSASAEELAAFSQLNNESYQYQWFVDGEAIADATTAQYTLLLNDLDYGQYALSVAVTDALGITHTLATPIDIVSLSPQSNLSIDVVSINQSQMELAAVVEQSNSVDTTTSTPAHSFAVNLNSDIATLDNDATVYSWDFGNGDTAEGEEVSYLYTAVGEYTITLTAQYESIVSTATTSIDINELSAQTASFTVIEQANNPNSYTIDASSSFIANADAVSMHWTLNDEPLPQTAEQFTYSFSGGSNTLVLALIENGEVIDTVSKTITVNLPADIDFIIDQNAQIVSLSAVARNNDNMFITDQYLYSWTFGDDQDAKEGANVTHVYNESATFSITLTATHKQDGSEIIISKDVEIEISALPIIHADLTSSVNGLYVNLNVNAFIDNAIDGFDSLTYIWDLGDGTTQEGLGLNFISHQYAAEDSYDVSVEVKQVASQFSLDKALTATINVSNPNASCNQEHQYGLRQHVKLTAQQYVNTIEQVMGQLYPVSDVRLDWKSITQQAKTMADNERLYGYKYICPLIDNRLGGEEACKNDIINQLLPIVYQQQVTNTDKDYYAKLFDDMPFADAAHTALYTMFSSPKFYYRSEAGYTVSELKQQYNDYNQQLMAIPDEYQFANNVTSIDLTNIHNYQRDGSYLRISTGQSANIEDFKFRGTGGEMVRIVLEKRLDWEYESPVTITIGDFSTTLYLEMTDSEPRVFEFYSDGVGTMHIYNDHEDHSVHVHKIEYSLAKAIPKYYRDLTQFDDLDDDVYLLDKAELAQFISYENTGYPMDVALQQAIFEDKLNSTDEIQTQINRLKDSERSQQWLLTHFERSFDLNAQACQGN